jgi:hypothetical protein
MIDIISLSFYVCLLVLKTVEELILECKPEDPIQTGNLKLSMFELIAIVPTKCNESFQIGMNTTRTVEL